ncbi:MAG: hypothetical protein AB8C84_02780 [Oligoflexales bacterium]
MSYIYIDHESSRRRARRVGPNRFRGLQWYEKILAMIVTPILVFGIVSFIAMLMFLGLCYVMFQIVCMSLAFWRSAARLR